MMVIDLDSHSCPRREDYVIDPQYEHLRPRSYSESKGNMRRIFDNRPALVESQITAKKGKSTWEAVECDGAVSYEQVTDKLLACCHRHSLMRRKFDSE